MAPRNLSRWKSTSAAVAGTDGSSSSSISAQATGQTQTKEIPVPSGAYPWIGHLPRLMRDADGSKTWNSMADECGDLFRAKLPGNKSFVVTSDASHVKEVLLNQGRFPYRLDNSTWRSIFDEQKWPMPIPILEGEAWRRNRRVLAETLLSAKNAKAYLPAVLPKANNFVDSLAGHLDQDNDSRLVKDVSIRQLAGLFALEAVVKVVLGADFSACTAAPINPEATSFTKSVETMFTTSRQCENMPWNAHFKLKPYREQTKAWQEMHYFPKQLLQPLLDHYEEHGELPESAKGTILPRLIEQLQDGELSIDEVLGIGIQAIIAAVDTTGQTFEYLLYNLAQNTDVQDRLAADAIAAFGKDGPLQYDDEADLQSKYDQQEYLFATLKESMRYTPTVGAHVRTLVQDAHLAEQKQPEGEQSSVTVPAGEKVLINFLRMTRNPDFFPEPDLFLPERFLKKSSAASGAQRGPAAGRCPMTSSRIADALQKDSDGNSAAVCKEPYAAIPFGHGARKCLGKGFAELDVHLAAIALLRKFHVTYNGPPLVQVEKSLLRPKTPIHPHFRFEAR